MATATADDARPAESGIFNNETTNSRWWSDYAKARPQYTNTFYDLLFRYHETKQTIKPSGKRYELLHDIGIGPGNLTLPISSRFDHVIASDISDSALSAAAELLPADIKSKTTLVNIGVEELGFAAPSELKSKTISDGAPLPGDYEPTSADAVFLGICIHLLDPVTFMPSVAKLLRPGGTLAITLYGHFVFKGNRGARCQEIYRKVNTKITNLAKKGPMSDEFWHRTAAMLTSWLDNVAFSEKDWERVERHKWNTSYPLTFLDDNELGFKPTFASHVNPTENIIVHDPDELPPQQGQWSMKDVQAYLRSAFPPLNAAMEGGDETFVRLFKEMEEVIGDPEEKIDVTLASVVLLATKK